MLHLPGAAAHAARSSLGGALTVASHLPAAAAPSLASVAKTSFVGGVNLADLLGMSVALAGALVALAFLPAWARHSAPVRAPGGPDDERPPVGLVGTPPLRAQDS